MYHAPSQNPADEYVELFNPGTSAVSISGWKLKKGVQFTFQNSSVPAGGFLVIAANLTNFAQKYPGITNVVGPWSGSLNNSSDSIELADAAGNTIDEVRYFDEGDWAVRTRENNLGSLGWIWVAEHDGGGKSLELQNPALLHGAGQNWKPSAGNGGTPGRTNSVYSTNLPPLILEAAHYPLIPSTNQPVFVTARIVDELSTGATARLYFRLDGVATFTVTNMTDDGLQGDGTAGDGIFGAAIPPNPASSIVEFYIEATDAGGLARTWPAPARQVNGTFAQNANALYQVDQRVPGKFPLYRLIIKQDEESVLKTITTSDAQMNATFISTDPTGVQLRYNTGVRNRGHGSRSASPRNRRIDFPSDRRWKGVSSINLNAVYSYSQVAGSAIAQRAGLPAANAMPVQLIVNGAEEYGSQPAGGFYAQIETLDSDYAENHFPSDSGGNVYRGFQDVAPADFYYVDNNENSYRASYLKQSNISEDDFSDVIELCTVLDKTADTNFVAEVRRVIDVENWMKYFALMTLFDNAETALSNGYGDDYFMYRGVKDRRFRLLPYDLDSILGYQGSTYSAGIFRMTQQNTNDTRSRDPRPVRRFVTDPELVPIYFQQLLGLMDTTFSAPQLNPLLDQVFAGKLAAGDVQSMKNFAANRITYIRSLIPRSITATAALPQSSGYYRSLTPFTALNGAAPPDRVRTVKVSGQTSDWLGWKMTWTNNNVALNPGINRILVQGFGLDGAECDRTRIDIWYDRGLVLPVLVTTIATDTTWAAANGPYLLNTDLIVNPGATLTIEPGATVFMGPGANIRVAGKLIARGTDEQHIIFTCQPGSGGNNTWGTLIFNGSGVTNQMSYVDLEYSGSGSHVIEVSSSTLLLDHATISGTTKGIIELTSASLRVQDSVFPNISGAEVIHGGPMPANGFVIIQRNRFGSTTDLNDIIDFTGAQRPGPVLQILDNVFTSASDDVLDLDGTDAHVEGNIFMHVHKLNPNVGDTSSAISGGKNGTDTSRVTIVRNIFFDCDHGILAKEGNFYTIVNNTFLNCKYAVVNFDEPERRGEGVTPGKGVILDGNLIWNTPLNFTNVYVNHAQFGTTELTVNRNLSSASDFLDHGTGNFVADPRFRFSSTGSITSVTITNDLRLLPGSPAVGTGPNGLDRGALVPAGASISGEPYSPTPRNEATLGVDGPGITHYKFQLNNGTYGAETPVAAPIELSSLSPGTNVVRVIGKNSAGVWQATNSPTVSKVWVVDPASSGVRLNEVLARNSATLIGNGYPDLVELHNSSKAAADLSGMGLSDKASSPFRFQFPQGTILPPGGFLVVRGGKSSAGSILSLGFSLDGSGSSLYLSASPAKGGALIDTVTLGLQASDFSIGRFDDGSWKLCVPTPGAANRLQPMGDVRSLRINEWLASAYYQSASDFIELFNPDPLPVALGGLLWTDQPGVPEARSPIAPLSFASPRGYVVFHADGDRGEGADHVSFKLNAEQSYLALNDPAGREIDVIWYGQQRTDISEGRSPDGSSQRAFLNPPTPGRSNGGMTVTVVTQTVTLVSMTNSWTYYESGAAPSGWMAPAFDDSAWSSGQALLYVETADLPAPKNTPLTIGKTTYYFRTHFTPPSNGGNLSLKVFTIIDDGAVVYLNGNEVMRLGMPDGPVTYDTLANRGVGDAAQEGPFIIPVEAMLPGDNVLAVEVHQNSATSSDIVFGLRFDEEATFSSALTTVSFSEVLARSQTFTNAAGRSLDFVELYNSSTQPVDLSGSSLSNDALDPRRFVFPQGTTIPASSYCVIYFDDPDAAPGQSPRFKLSADGDRLFLFNRPADGGGLVDLVEFGPQAADYSISRGGAAGWILTQPTPGGANGLAAELGSPGLLRVNEWMADPKSGEDWLELFNGDGKPVSLAGLCLSDDPDDRLKSPIPPLSFIGAGSGAYQKFVADSSPESGGNHVRFRLGTSGDRILLSGASGVQLDAVSFQAQYRGVSQGRFPDGDAAIRLFPGASSPGESNYVPLENIAINEILPAPGGSMEQAIELLNTGGSPVDVSGWYLSDQAGWFTKFAIPAGTLIPAHGTAVLYQNQFGGAFRMDAIRGGRIVLSATAGGKFNGLRGIADYESTPSGVSWGRFASATALDFVPLASTTFGNDSPTSVEQFRQGTGKTNAAPSVGPLVITEIMYLPTGTNGVEDPLGEFVEIRNISHSSVALFDSTHPTNTWRLRGGVDLELPSISLAAGKFLVLVSFDPDADAASASAFRSRYGIDASVLLAGPFQGRLDNRGDRLELRKPGTPATSGPNAGFVPYYLVDRVEYGSAAPWPQTAGNSIHRSRAEQFGNDFANWVAGAATPGGESAGDADADGIPDAWERDHGLDPARDDSAEDPDGDGLSNLEEYLGNSDPHNAGNPVRFSSEIFSGNDLELHFHSIASRSYTAQFSDSLAPVSWQSLGTAVGNGSEMVFVDPAAKNRPARFYRLILQP